MEGGELLSRSLSLSLLLEADTATRQADRGATPLLLLLRAALVVLRAAIREGLLVDAAMRQRVIVRERERERAKLESENGRMLRDSSWFDCDPWPFFFLFHFFLFVFTRDEELRRTEGRKKP